MGGCGSGRRKTRDRTLVEDCDSIDICFISEIGCSIYPILGEIENKDGKEYLLIDYNKYWFGPRLDEIENIELEKTFPHFGGERLWLKCPGCGKRKGKVYRPPPKILFKCRTCYDLMYRSQESNVYDGIRKKLAKANGMSPKQYDRMVFV